VTHRDNHQHQPYSHKTTHNNKLKKETASLQADSEEGDAVADELETPDQPISIEWDADGEDHPEGEQLDFSPDISEAEADRQ
jgi:hypothetical protein